MLPFLTCFSGSSYPLNTDIFHTRSFKQFISILQHLNLTNVCAWFLCTRGNQNFPQCLRYSIRVNSSRNSYTCTKYCFQSLGIKMLYCFCEWLRSDLPMTRPLWVPKAQAACPKVERMKWSPVPANCQVCPCHPPSSSCICSPVALFGCLLDGEAVEHIPAWDSVAEWHCCVHLRWGPKLERGDMNHCRSDLMSSDDASFSSACLATSSLVSSQKKWSCFSVHSDHCLLWE